MACCRRCNSRRNQTNVRVFNDNNFIPSTVQVNYPLTQNVGENAEALFAQVDYNTGVSFSPRYDELGIDIVAPGVYKITFTGIVTTEANQTISLAISLNGEPIPQSEISQYVTTLGPQTVITTVIFKVISPNADIGIINTSTNNFNLTNAKLEIVRTGNFWREHIV